MGECLILMWWNTPFYWMITEHFILHSKKERENRDKESLHFSKKYTFATKIALAISWRQESIFAIAFAMPSSHRISSFGLVPSDLCCFCQKAVNHDWVCQETKKNCSHCSKCTLCSLRHMGKPTLPSLVNEFRWNERQN